MKISSIVCVLLAAIAGACSSPPPTGKAGPPPATVSGKPNEAELATLTLTEEAERRLGIEVVVAVEKPLRNTREVAGELMVPPGRTMLVAAPAAGVVSSGSHGAPPPGAVVRAGQELFRLAPFVAMQRDLQVSYASEATAAKARFDAARMQLERARQLLADRAGSQRSVEQAEQEHRQAEAAFQAASARLERLREHPLESDVVVPITAPGGGVVRQVSVAPGVQVSAGTVLAEIVDTRVLWIRLPLYPGDARELDRSQTVEVRPLGTKTGTPSMPARPVQGPPVADAAAVSIDIYYEIDNLKSLWRPGERALVSLPLGTSEIGIVLPASAIVYDMNGDAWVYSRTAAHTYQRRRVLLRRSAGGQVLVEGAVRAGDAIVSVGVAEIFGAEFGNGK
ncbi:MAG: efflux RND transporter periplasmic adaptor subunit [Vicinamibacterales bacterium]